MKNQVTGDVHALMEASKCQERSEGETAAMLLPLAYKAHRSDKAPMKIVFKRFDGNGSSELATEKITKVPDTPALLDLRPWHGSRLLLKLLLGQAIVDDLLHRWVYLRPRTVRHLCFLFAHCLLDTTEPLVAARLVCLDVEENDALEHRCLASVDLRPDAIVKRVIQ